MSYIEDAIEDEDMSFIRMFGMDSSKTGNKSVLQNFSMMSDKT